MTPGDEIAPDGRVGWPDVLVYELCDYRSLRSGEVVVRPLIGDLPEPCRIQPTGELVIVPPMDGRPYRMCVKDFDRYEVLFKSGRLSGPPHRVAGGAVDNRRAPGA